MPRSSAQAHVTRHLPQASPQLHSLPALASVLAISLVLAIATAVCAGCAAGSENAADQTEAAGSNAVSSDVETDVEETDWSTGTHHAVLVFEGIDEEVEITVSSDEAPESAEAFCELVEKGYYDSKKLWLVLPELYARLGASTSKGDHLVTGEFAEAVEEVEETTGEDAYDESSYAESTSDEESPDAGSTDSTDSTDADAADDGDADSERVVSSMSLTKGVIALARATDDETLSDASSFIVFLSDMSYLDGQYAAFAKVTDGLDAIESIADRAMTRAEERQAEEAAEADGGSGAGEADGTADAEEDEEPITTRSDGRIVLEDRPVIESIRMVD